MAEDWPRQNGKTAISEHINALQARINELEAIVACVQHYGYAYEFSDHQSGAKHLLDPKDVTVFLPRERADEFLASWDRRALRAEAERAELERQKDAVLALCDDGDKISPQYTDVTKRIRKIYGGGE